MHERYESCSAEVYPLHYSMLHLELVKSVWKTQTFAGERMAQPSCRQDSSVMEQQESGIMTS